MENEMKTHLLTIVFLTVLCLVLWLMTLFPGFALFVGASLAFGLIYAIGYVVVKETLDND
jgi:putative flippase GtrA